MVPLADVQRIPAHSPPPKPQEAVGLGGRGERQGVGSYSACVHAR